MSKTASFLLLMIVIVGSGLVAPLVDAASYVKITSIYSPYTSSTFSTGQYYTVSITAEYSNLPVGSDVGFVITQRGLSGYIDFGFISKSGSGTTTHEVDTRFTEAGHYVWTIAVGYMPYTQLDPDRMPVSDTRDLTFDVFEPEIEFDIHYPDEVVPDEQIQITVTGIYHHIPPKSSLSLELRDDQGAHFDSPGQISGLGDALALRYEEESSTTGTGTISAKFIPYGHGSIPRDESAESLSMVVWAWYTYAADPPWHVGFETFSISQTGQAQIQVTNVKYTMPPDTIQVGERTPVVVSIKYNNLYAATKVGAEIYDTATGSLVGESLLSTLSGSSTYTFDPITITPTYSGDWKLRVQVTAEGVSATSGTEDFTIKVSGTLEQVEITDTERPSGTIAVGEDVPIVVTIEYSNLPPNTQLHLEIKDEDTGKYAGSGTESTYVKLAGSGTYTFKPDTISPENPGDWHLRVAITGLIGGEWSELASKKFTLQIVQPAASAQVTIKKITYPEQPETVPLEEERPVIVTIDYKNLAPGTKLEVRLKFEGITYDSAKSTALSGSGTYTFPDLTIGFGLAGVYDLDVEVTLENKVVASSQITVKAVTPTSSGAVEITKIEYVKPPDIIAIGEPTPIRVTIKYENLPSKTKLTCYLKDHSATVATKDATLSGTGTYTYSLTVAPTKPGDWDLTIDVGGTEESITIKVEAPTGSVQVAITKLIYVKSPDTVVVGESTIVTVSIEYKDAAPGTQLRVSIRDLDTNNEAGSAASAPLSGSGKYTFPAVTIKPTRPGDWHLEAQITLSGIIASERFTLKVIAPAGEPAVRIVRVEYVEPPDTIAVGESTNIIVTIEYKNLPPGTKLTVYINDDGNHKKLTSMTSPALSGSGTYTFKAIIIRPDRPGDWKLILEIAGYPDTITKIIIKVVG